MIFSMTSFWIPHPSRICNTTTVSVSYSSCIRGLLERLRGGFTAFEAETGTPISAVMMYMVTSMNTIIVIMVQPMVMTTNYVVPFTVERDEASEDEQDSGVLAPPATAVVMMRNLKMLIRRLLLLLAQGRHRGGRDAFDMRMLEQRCSVRGQRHQQGGCLWKPRVHVC